MLKKLSEKIKNVFVKLIDTIKFKVKSMKIIFIDTPVIFVKKKKMDWDIYWEIIRPIRRLSKLLYKLYGKNKSDLKWSYDDCVIIASGINWNDLEPLKDVLSFIGNDGERIFPRPLPEVIMDPLKSYVNQIVISQ